MAPGGCLGYLSPAAALILAAPEDGESFQSFAARALGGGGEIERAIEAREGWSAIPVCWPSREGVRPVRVELSAAPAPDGGLRGFGLALVEPASRREPPAGERSSTSPLPSDEHSAERAAGNVLRFPGGEPAPTAERRLDPEEAAAFREIGATLGGSLAESPGRSASLFWSDEAISGERTDDKDSNRAGTEDPLRAARAEADGLRAILDTAADGVIVFGADGRVQAINRPAQALFDLSAAEARGRHVTRLFAAESQRALIDYIDALAEGGRAAAFNDGRELVAIERQGGRVPLSATIGRLETRDGQTSRFCAVLRDATQAKRAERELAEARRRADLARRDKADSIERLGQQVRRPLGSIIELTETMLAERFGPLANERYRGAVADIRASSESLLTLVSEIVDLARAEAGRLDLSFAELRLSDLARDAVAALQAQANREGVILRTALPATPPVLADATTLRQAVFQLIAGAIRASRRGGQVIVSTGVGDGGAVYLRVRDRSAALPRTREPAAEPGFALPLSKALAEANLATMTIDAARPGEGVVVEIAFPPERVAAAPAAIGSA